MDGPRLLPRTGCAQPSRPAARSSKSDRQEWLPILPHIVPPSAPARGGQAAVSGGMGCCRRLWLRLATLIFHNRTCRSLGTSFASADLFTPALAMRAAGCSLRLAENCGRRTLRTRASVFRRKEPAYSCARPHTGIAFTHESWSAEPDRAPLGFRFRLLRPPRERRDRCRLVPDA